MITFFTCPKAFKNLFYIIQKNAILSWINLPFEKEILIMGDEPGVENFCRKFNLKQIKNIKRNENGIPVISSIFEKAAKIALYDILCFINTDIILIGNMKEAVESIKNKFDKFILSGFRIDVDLEKEIDFTKKEDVNLLMNLIRSEKEKLNKAPDFFIYPKNENLFFKFPPFLIGRFFWDNWLFYYAHKNKIPLINVNSKIKAIHQNHPAYLKKEDYLFDKIFSNEEIFYNFKLANIGAIYTAEDFDYVLQEDYSLMKISKPTQGIKLLLKIIYFKMILLLRNSGQVGKILYKFLKFFRKFFVSIQINEQRRKEKIYIKIFK